MGGTYRIVVGVEGSGGARSALRWAVTEAAHRVDAVVEVVTAYALNFASASPDFGYVAVDSAALLAEVVKMQDRVVADVLDHTDAAGVKIEQRTVQGRPVDSLIEASEGASMLVVGSRGRGGFRGLLLGSVSQQLAQHASCPLVIVRPDLMLDHLT